MPLAPGTRLGPYEITGPLGAGGMGEVYRAQDTRLNRTVAVKTLPGHLAKDPALKARFEREARAVSSLSHPHICTLHDIGEQDGIYYLVMEHLDGESLAERLTRGPLPVGAAAAIAAQVAGALALAHRNGVVHRDLKPGNVMLTKGGAKLLDFGLAKQGPEAAPPISSALMTRESPLTAAGTIVGTWQYLSPEQLEGGEADARSDIFAFGAVLYEMLTGRRAFDGRSQASLIAAIMTTQPPPLASAAPDTPPALERVVRRCLAKDPDDRWQSAADLASELRWIAGGEDPGAQSPVPGAPSAVVAGTPVPASGAAIPQGPPGSGSWGPASVAAGAYPPSQAGDAETGAPRSTSRERIAWVVAAVSLLAALGAVAAWRAGASPPEAPRAVHASLLPPPGTHFDVRYPPAVSPDGRSVAFVGVGEQGVPLLHVVDLGSGRSRVLEETNGAGYPFWSPDGRWIGFYSGEKLKKVDVAGGPSFPLCDARDGRGGSWSREGVILFQPRFSESLFKVPAAGGTPEPVTVLDESRFDVAHRWPHFLPDGRRFLFYIVSTTNPGASEHSGIYLGSLDGGEPRQILKSDSRGEYALGYLLYRQGTTLMAQRFDLERAETTGDPLPLAASIAGGVYSWGGAEFGVSESGMLVYMGGAGDGKTDLAWFDRSGERIGALGEPDLYWDARISHDGSRVVMGIGRDASDLWLQDVARDVRTRFTFDPADDADPVWSPDDRRVAFGSSRESIGGIYLRDTSGSAEEELIHKMGAASDLSDWSPDGKYLAIGTVNPKTGADLWLYSFDDGEARPWMETPADEFSGRFSPDGRWLAYASTESGRTEVYVQAFPEPKGRWQVSRAGGQEPAWRADGRELFFYSPLDGQVMAVDVRAGSSFSTGEPKALFRVTVKYSSGTVFDATGDGQRFLLNTPGEAGPVGSSASLVLNWPESLRQ